jgi:hypothetical protein
MRILNDFLDVIVFYLGHPFFTLTKVNNFSEIWIV